MKFRPVVPSRLAAPEHEILYQDLLVLINRHPTLNAREVLAVAANMVGKIVAMQDQRATTPEEALDIVMDNIEEGNKQVVDLMFNSQGSA